MDKQEGFALLSQQWINSPQENIELKMCSSHRKNSGKRTGKRDFGRRDRHVQDVSGILALNNFR